MNVYVSTRNEDLTRKEIYDNATISLKQHS